MEKTIEISFIVAVYNVEKYIKECLESLKSLSGNTYEFIIIDDGSTDKSGVICDKFQEKDIRFKVIHQSNQGVSVARNVGIDAAEGKWICFVDGDDYIVTERLKNNIIPLLDESNDIIYFAYKQVIGKTLATHNIPEASSSSFIKEPTDMRILKYAILNPDYKAVRQFKGVYNFCSPWGKMYKAELLKKNSLSYPPNIIRAQDSIFNIRVSDFVQRIKFLPYEGYVYRRNMSSITNKYTPDMVDHCKSLIEQYEELLKNSDDATLVKMYAEWKVKQLYNLLKSVFCNPNNPEPYKIRRENFKKVKNCPEFIHSFKYTELKDFKINRRIIIYCMKKNIFWILNMYFRNTGIVQFMQKIMYRMGLE